MDPPNVWYSISALKVDFSGEPPQYDLKLSVHVAKVGHSEVNIKKGDVVQWSGNMCVYRPQFDTLC